MNIIYGPRPGEGGRGHGYTDGDVTWDTLNLFYYVPFENRVMESVSFVSFLTRVKKYYHYD